MLRVEQADAASPPRPFFLCKLTLKAVGACQESDFLSNSYIDHSHGDRFVFPAKSYTPANTPAGIVDFRKKDLEAHTVRASPHSSVRLPRLEAQHRINLARATRFVLFVQRARRAQPSLKELRVQGDGKEQGQQRKGADRIYEFDVYNDLGKPLTAPGKVRPTLGGPRMPFPR